MIRLDWKRSLWTATQLFGYFSWSPAERGGVFSLMYECCGNDHYIGDTSRVGATSGVHESSVSWVSTNLASATASRWRRHGDICGGVVVSLDRCHIKHTDFVDVLAYKRKHPKLGSCVYIVIGPSKFSFCAFNVFCFRPFYLKHLHYWQNNYTKNCTILHDYLLLVIPNSC